jgi:HlyD family secretion protein
MKNIRPKPLILALLVLAAVAALAWFFLGERTAPPAATVRPALTVATVQPQRESLPTTLAANGNIMAWQEASVGAEAAGLRLTQVRANVGDRVRQG